jgi:hypothetical protein
MTAVKAYPLMLSCAGKIADTVTQKALTLAVMQAAAPLLC